MVYIQFIILNFVKKINKYCIKLTIAYTCICSPQIALHYSKLALAYKSQICHLDHILDLHLSPLTQCSTTEPQEHIKCSAGRSLERHMDSHNNSTLQASPLTV